MNANSHHICNSPPMSARCHIADGNVQPNDKQWPMSSFVVLVWWGEPHPSVIPTHLTDSQMTNNDICHHLLTCHNHGTWDNNAGQQGDNRTMTWQGHRMMMQAQWQGYAITIQQQHMVTMWWQCRTTMDDPHLGISLTTSCPSSFNILLFPFNIHFFNIPFPQHPASREHPLPLNAPLINIPLPFNTPPPLTSPFNLTPLYHLTCPPFS